MVSIRIEHDFRLVTLLIDEWPEIFNRSARILYSIGLDNHFFNALNCC